MGTRTYGSFMIHLTDDAMMQISPECFTKIIDIYKNIGIDWKQQKAMLGEHFAYEIKEFISENVGDDLSETEIDQVAMDVLIAWKYLVSDFLEKTGIVFGLVFLDTDSYEWHGELDEGVNFYLDFNEAYVKSPALLAIEQNPKIKTKIESFTVWG